MTSGELRAETLTSASGARRVSAYVPPGTVEAVVFAGDGQLVAPWGADLVGTGLPPTLVVGVHAADDEEQRLHEYSPAFDPELFARHERFLVDDVRRWTTTQLGVSLPPERTAILGVSAGGELAIALGLRHPDVFGTVLCASPGAGFRPPATLPDRLPQTYFVAGTREPFFRDNATRWARALHEAGRDVVVREREGAHGDRFWRGELPLMVAWAFGG